MGVTFQLNVTLQSEDCGKCGGTFALNAEFMRQKLENGGSWHCPYCRMGWSYTKSEADRLKDKLAAEERRTAAEKAQHDQTKASLRDTEKSLAVQKGQVTKLKNKAASGKCPCCDKKFNDLADHMKNQHPDFQNEPAEESAAK